MLAAARYPIPDGDSETEVALPKAVDELDLEGAGNIDPESRAAAVVVPMGVVAPIPAVALPRATPLRSKPSAMGWGNSS